MGDIMGKTASSAEEAIADGFFSELEKMGVSLSFIAERLTPGLTGEARAASGKVWETLGSQAKNRGELRDLVHERLRTRGRFSGPTHEVDATLFKRLRKDPAAKATYDAAVDAKMKAMAARPAAAAPAAPPAAAAAAQPSLIKKHLGKMMLGGGLVGAGAALSTTDKNAAAAFNDELSKLGMLIKEAPFKSEAQRRKFYALKSKGKMDQKTINEWESETPADLPERVKKHADDKTALEKATILGAIFRRAFKGKIMGSQSGRMANRFLQTSKAMGSEPTREGLRGMITKVRETGTV